ncbi:hypothetical protein ILUMI_25914 [Ignelater luminosus]|uniref:Reverse transcriptase Ty1/copia-type domain-containing protein n=1 Tax=Ignelater luminosus TaxID=2038154 RepID=A0A8K0C7J8_IGNLU|nr:hypothetical protein ILUMI_25914 [Ignelater luminosus]
MNENGNMKDPITELINLFQKLTDIGEEKLSKKWTVAMILSSLPRSYDTLITALETRPEADITLSLVKSKLINEYNRRKKADNSNNVNIDRCLWAYADNVTKRIFGSQRLVHVPSQKRRKLNNTAIQIIFAGYDQNSKAYRCYDPVQNKLVISREVSFIDYQEINNKRKNSDLRSSKERSTESENLNSSSEVEINLSGSSISRTNNQESDSDSNVGSGDKNVDESLSPEEESAVPVRTMSSRMTEGVPASRYIQGINLIGNEIVEPKNLSEALSSKTKIEWIQPMEDEINFDIDYDQVFAPVAKQATFRTLLAVVLKKGLLVYHFDAKTAFLNGKLKETMFMKQPPRFAEKGKEDFACLLLKILCGLKQAAKSWNEAIKEVLINATGERRRHQTPAHLKESFIYRPRRPLKSRHHKRLPKVALRDPNPPEMLIDRRLRKPTSLSIAQEERQRPRRKEIPTSGIRSTTQPGCHTSL